MTTVKNIVLVILTVRCAIVLSQHETTQRNNETSPGNTAQRIAIIAQRQGQMETMTDERKLVVNTLQTDVKGLRAEFTCHFSPCHSYACTFLSNNLSYRTENTQECETLSKMGGRQAIWQI